MEVLFDVDGVVVFPWQFRTYLATEHGISPGTTRSFFQGPFVRCTRGENELRKELLPYLEQWNWDGTVDSFIETWLAVENAPDRHVLGFVDNLRKQGVRCHVASTQEVNRAAYLTHEMDLKNKFDSLLFSCHLGAAKPDKEYCRRAEMRLSKTGKDILLVDDNLDNIEVARDLGWQAVHYQGYQTLDEVNHLLRLVV